MTGNPFDPRGRSDRFDHADLTGRILDRTSGRACDRAADLLGARWDATAGDPDELVDAGLLAAHLEHCAGCRDLAAALDRLQPLLPDLAERDPGPAFTAAVLAATSGRRAAASAAVTIPGRGPLDRLADALRRAWERPRFALEAAWTAAALATVLLWGPWAPAGAADDAGQLVRAGATSAPRLIERVDELADAAGLAARTVLGPRMERAETAARRHLDALVARATDLKQDGRELWQRLTDDDTRPAER
jgi:hypothetical protein